MSLSTLMIQEYPSGVYLLGTLYYDPKRRLIQSNLEIFDSPFASSKLLTLDRLLPPISTPTNITIFMTLCTISSTYHRSLQHLP